MTNLFGASLASLVLVFFFFASSNARVITEATNDVINDICPKTINQSFCSGVLKSAGTTDLKALALYTIKLASTDSKDAFKQAQSLLQKETDPKLKKIYKSCVEYLDDAIGDLDEGKELLGSGDYVGVTISGSAAMTKADICSYDLPKAAKSSPLLQKIKLVDDTCSIIFVIGNILRGASKQNSGKAYFKLNHF